MGGVARGIALAVLRRLVNLVLVIPSFVRVHTPLRRRILHMASFEEHATADYAIVAIYPREGLTRSVRNVLRALARHRINVILVSNGPLSAADRELVSGQVATLIERENLGRDFGAYQAGMRHLRRTGKLATCRKLLMINDSVFYACSIDRLVAEVLEKTEPFVGLFEIFEHHYHVSAFFLCFSQAVLVRREFLRFWARYKPYSTRHHLVFAGEARLTSVLMKLNVTPHIVYSSSAAHAALSAKVEENPAACLAELTTQVPEPWVGPLLSQYTAMSAQTEPAKMRTLVENMIADFIREAESANQAHGLALCANRLLRSPVLKRDLCYRGFWSIGALLQRIEGFDEQERAEMLLELRRKGKAPSHLGLGRLLYLVDA